MRKYLESWGGALAFAVAIAGGGWLIATSIGAVRSELSTEMGAIRTELVELELRMESRLSAVEARLSAVEAKLDLLIMGLNIDVKMAEGGGS